MSANAMVRRRQRFIDRVFARRRRRRRCILVKINNQQVIDILCRGR